MMVGYWFTCPECGILATVDEDQAEGRVSIQCNPPCTFHETGKVRPKIPSTTATKPSAAPSTLEKGKRGR